MNELIKYNNKEIKLIEIKFKFLFVVFKQIFTTQLKTLQYQTT